MWIWKAIPVFFERLTITFGIILLLLCASLIIIHRLFPGNDWEPKLLEFKRYLSPQRERKILFGILMLFFILLGLLKSSQYMLFHLGSDFGFTANCIWNTLHGEFLSSDFYESSSYLAYHTSFVLLLYAPFLALSGSSISMAWGMILVLAVGLIPLWKLLCHLKTPPLLRWFWVSCYVLNPYIHEIARSFTGYEEVFAVPVLLCVILYVETKKWKYAFLWLILLFLVKEEAVVATFGIGAVVMILGYRRQGIIMILLSAIAGVILLGLIIPKYSSQSMPYAASLFSDFGDNYKEIALHWISHPISSLQMTLFNSQKLLATLTLIGSFAFLPLLNVPRLGACFPILLFHLMGPEDHGFSQFDIHYSAFVLPFLFWSGIHGSLWLLHRYEHIQKRLGYAFLLIAAFWAFAIPEYVGSYFLQVPLDKYIAAHEFIAMIPRDAEVWSYHAFAPNLACHRKLLSLPPIENTKSEPDAVIFNARPGNQGYILSESTRKLLERLVRTGNYQLLEKEGIALMIRKELI